MEKIALVTGASRGIGFAIAGRLAREGWSLFLVARDVKRLEDAAARLREAAASHAGREKPRFIPFAVDLADPRSPEMVITALQEHFGHLDLLVNNAGVASSGPIDTYSQDDWERTMNINARAPFFLMSAALPLLAAAPHGRIINIGSVVSKKGYVDQALYAASKHALLGMTKSAARDLADRGILVHAILPGGVATDLVRNVRPDIDESELVSPDDIAETIVYLLGMNGNAVVDEISIRRRTKEAWG